MACVALASLIGTIEIEFVQSTPRVSLSLHYTPLIISFLENLSCLQAFLHNKSKSSGDDFDDTLRDLEIKIRDFALKAEDDIELQLSNIAEEKDQLLHQTLQGAAKIAKKLLESCVSEREMATVALTILIKKFRHYYLQYFPAVYGGDEAKSFLEKLSSLRGCLLQEANSNSNDSGAAIEKLETEIRIFALKAEDDLKIQLSNFLVAKHTEHEEEASQELHQTLRKAAKIAAELFQIINREKEHDREREREREMACNALTSLRKTIDEMEYYRLSMASLHDNDKDKVGIKSNLLEKLSSLQVILHKESSGGGAAMKPLVTIIEHFELKARYDINLQLSNLLQAKDTEYEHKVSQELHLTMQEVEEGVAELLNIVNSRRGNEEVDDEANETQPSNTYWLKHSADGSSSNGFLKPEGRMVGRLRDYRVIKSKLIFQFGLPEGRMVGRLHDYRVIKSQLIFKFGLRIISIFGMVGIGKTMLARKLYEDPSVASHFNIRGWVTIPPPQHYNKRRMLSELLRSITTEEPNVIKKGSTSDEVEMQVRKCLRGKRYLIVLDNFMSNQALTDITNCVPYHIAGNCILLTTRHFNQYNHGSNYIHNMNLLDPKESWELFCNILSIDEEHLAPKFEKIRNHVVEKCDGLPQLIVEVANRLSKCNNIQQGWKKIEKELESLGILDRNALMVSYNMLPRHLKVCFLYFSVFPKRNRILVKVLIRLWIAEGFVKAPEHKELEDQVYEYLQELINGSLLLIENRSFDGKIKTCRMHSAIHTFCVGEAQKEGILCAVNTNQHSGLSLKAFANSCRWLSFYSHSFDYYVLFGTNITRSIFFFHENPKMFVLPKLLRVLAFDTSISLLRGPMQLGGLVFLRYLSITQWFKDLNDVVSNSPNLETLVVYGNGAPTVHLPSSIWKPPPLRHLELGNSYMVDPPSAYKKNLQTLSWVVRPVHCRKKMYSKFPNIKNLKILVKDGIEPPSHIGGCCSNPIILDHFDYFKWLEKLSISIDCNAALTEQCLYPLGLKKLKLSGTNISERDLNVIAKLPQLKVLKLKHAFHGTVWKVADRGFPELIFLLLEAKELEQWVVSSQFGGFFKFKHLVLRSCNCLEQMPENFKGYGLESIKLEGCHSSLVASAKQFQQKRRLKNLKIKIMDPKYDESQNTHTEDRSVQ